MGLRSPQEMEITSVQPQRATRLQGGRTGQIDPSFLRTLESITEQREKERLEGAKASTKLAEDMAEQQIREKEIEAKAKAASTQGLNALQETSKQREELLKQANDIVSKMPVELQAKMQPKILKSVNNFNVTAIPHQYGEIAKVREQVGKDKIVARRDDAIERSADMEWFSTEGLKDVADRATEYGRLKYGNEANVDVGGLTAGEAIHAIRKEAVAETVVGAIEVQAKTNRLSTAQELFAKHEKDLTPAMKVKALNILKKAEVDTADKLGLSFAEMAMKQYPEDMAAQEAFMRANAPNEDVYKSGVAFAKSISGIKAQQKKFNDEKNLGEALDAISKGQPLTAKSLENVDPKYHDKVRTYAINQAQGKYNPTDTRVFNSLLKQVQDDPEGFATSLNLSAYAADLNEEDQKFFKRIKTNLIEAGRKEDLRVYNRGNRVAKDVTSQFLNANKVFNPGQRSKVELAVFDYVYEMIGKGERDESKIRRSTLKALRDFGYKEEKRDTWFGLSSETIKTVLPSGSLKGEVHPSIINKIKTRYPKMSETEIQQVVSDMQKNGIDIYSEQ